MHACRQSDRQSDRHTYIEKDKHTDKQTDSRGKCQQRVIVKAEEDRKILEK